MSFPSMSVEPSRFDEIRRMGGDKLLLKLMGLLVETGPSRWDQVRRSVAEGRWENAQRQAHSLKTSVGNLGARSLMAKLGELESSMRAAGEGGRAPAAANLEPIEVEFRALLQFLEKEKGRFRT